VGVAVGVGSGFDDVAAECEAVDDGCAEPQISEGLGPANQPRVENQRTTPGREGGSVTAITMTGPALIDCDHWSIPIGSRFVLRNSLSDPFSIPSDLFVELRLAFLERTCGTWQSRKLTQHRLIVRDEAFVAGAAEGNEVFLRRRTVHAPRNEVVDVQLNIDVIHRPAAAYHASVVIPLEHLHAERSVGGTTLYRIIGEVLSPEEAEPANLHCTVVHALGRTDHVGYAILGELLFDQCVSTPPNENGKRRIVVHDQPALIDFLPQPHHPACIYEAGFPYLPTGVSFRPANKLRLPSPEGPSPPIRTQSESKVLPAGASGFQVTKPLNIIRVIKHLVRHTGEYPTAHRHRRSAQRKTALIQTTVASPTMEHGTQASRSQR
jgi:hypothetical protein